MNTESYDFVVIGGGSAGYAAARTAAALGLKTVVVEGGDEVGGLCILRGCMPSKTLLESAHRAEVIRHADAFGLRAEYGGADPAAIRARKRRLIGEFADYRRGQLEDGRFAFIRGRAQFVDAHTIEVKSLDGLSRTIQGGAFLVATGSTIAIPSIPGLAETGYLTSDDVLDADTLPSSVCVLGGGAIALELATFYAGLGSSVTVIQRSAQVLREMDVDVADELVRGMEHRGITIHRKTKIERIERRDAQRVVHFRDRGGDQCEVAAEALVVALGRSPATEGLGLDSAGVTLEKGRVIASGSQQTNVPHIFAAGDVCGPYEVVHIAIQQAEIAARNAARVLGRRTDPLETMDYTLKLFGVFTQPEAASVGLTEREAEEQGLSVRSAKYPFADHGKSMVKDALHGFVKLIAETDSGRLVGGSCVGPDATELIHEIVVAMRFGATAAQLATTPHYHPTLSEIWMYPAEDLAEPVRS